MLISEFFTSKRISIILLSSTALFIGCMAAGSGFDETKKFNPEDKNLTAALENLHIVIETSDIAKVDTAFKKILDDYVLPISAKGCKDGEYTGESPYDDYDYKHVVKLEIKKGKVVALDYDEVHKNGTGKQDDEEYCREMSDVGTTPAIAFPVYENSLLERQNILEVDAVSGASYSLYRFRYAVTMALMKASL